MQVRKKNWRREWDSEAGLLLIPCKLLILNFAACPVSAGSALLPYVYRTWRNPGDCFLAWRPLQMPPPRRTATDGAHLPGLGETTERFASITELGREGQFHRGGAQGHFQRVASKLSSDQERRRPSGY